MRNKVKSDHFLYEHEALEVMLFYACPRVNVNPLAHRLLDRFGSFSAVFQATEAELLKVDGVGESVAAYLTEMGKVQNFMTDGGSKFAQIDSVGDFKKFILTVPYRGGSYFELWLCDASGRIKRRVELKPRHDEEFVTKITALSSAVGVFAVLNRPKGERPTPHDDGLFKRVKRMLAVSGVELYDFFIIAGGNAYYSYYIADRLSET